MKTLVFIFLLMTQFVLAQKDLTHEVFFDTDKSEVPETEHTKLLAFLSEIESLDIERISIYGFCDDRGSSDYNLKLSNDRANNIRAIFSNNEFDESVIINVDGKGEVLLKMVQEENIDKIRGLNRKVLIIAKQVFPPKPEVVVKTKRCRRNIKWGFKSRR